MPPKKTTTTKGATNVKATKQTPAKSTKGTQEKGKKEDKSEAGAEAVAVPPVEINLKDMAKLVFGEGGTVKESGRWALFIDPAERAATFLKYRDCNYVNTVDPAHMQTNSLRLALLGALWFGKPLVLDMGDVDMFNTVTEKLDEVEKGLMEAVLDKSIMCEEKILKLVRKEDGQEYEQIRLDETRFKDFQLIVTTAVPPNGSFAKRMCVLQIN